MEIPGITGDIPGITGEDAADEVADRLNLGLYVPTGQGTIDGEELIPWFAIPCLGCYCSPHHKCGCAANNQCFCLSVKCKPFIKLLKCGKEKNSGYVKIGFLKLVLKQGRPHFDIVVDTWDMKKRNCLIVGGDLGIFKFEVNIDDGLGIYRPGCSKPFCCFKCQNKCFCCVQQGAFPCDPHQAFACFGLACLPGCGCCKTVESLRIKKPKKAVQKILKKADQELEMNDAEKKDPELEMNDAEKKDPELEKKQASLQSASLQITSPQIASPQSSKKKKKKNKVKIKPGVDIKGGMKDMMQEL